MMQARWVRYQEELRLLKDEDNALFQVWLKETGRCREGIDVEALRACLRLTPTERLKWAQYHAHEYWRWRQKRQDAQEVGLTEQV